MTPTKQTIDLRIRADVEPGPTLAHDLHRAWLIDEPVTIVLANGNSYQVLVTRVDARDPQ